MNRSVCNFIAAFNQAIKKKSKEFKVKYFSLAFPLLNALVKEGFLQYYTLEKDTLRVYLRFNKNGLVVSYIKATSKPSKRAFVR